MFNSTHADERHGMVEQDSIVTMTFRKGIRNYAPRALAQRELDAKKFPLGAGASGYIG